jgi:hypothetical protein
VCTTGELCKSLETSSVRVRPDLDLALNLSEIQCKTEAVRKSFLRQKGFLPNPCGRGPIGLLSARRAATPELFDLFLQFFSNNSTGDAIGE